VKTTFDSNRGKFDLFFNNWLKGNLLAKFYVRWTIRQAANINNMISSLSIDGSQVDVSTTSLKSWLGIVNMNSISLTIPKEDMLWIDPRDGYPMKSKYLRQVYVFQYAGSEYYLVENFFDDFPALQGALLDWEEGE
jgi:hypothetical protein